MRTTARARVGALAVLGVAGVVVGAAIAVVGGVPLAAPLRARAQGY